MQNKGVIYTASGKKYVKEAIHSAKSIKKYNKDLKVTLFTCDQDVKSKYFDNVIVQPNNKHPQKYKIENMVNSPYDHTLYIDSDTEITASIAELFDFLLIYDMGLTNRVYCNFDNPKKIIFIDYIDKECYNGGFLLFNKTKETTEFLSQWSKIMNRNKDDEIRPGSPTGDQIPLNNLIFKENLLESLGIKYVILPNKIYNARPWCWKPMKEAGEFQNIKILHNKGLNVSLYTKVIRKIKHKIKSTYANR
ncbi:hypothetical protein [Robertkochia solimangrovi]|uniref:hypothetical protein n=1 Tax=Robertkochia solimangrovi TaxID=2213046 RepID=UPI00117EC248|nr:hypothetical protein [Robertkochia solimangrovi]TRZ44987.1 hypothetical protein DMZ48_04290 [Robertkochia solimangrovi]